MGLKYISTNLYNITCQEQLRLNFGYRYLFDIQKAVIFEYSTQIKLKHILKKLLIKKVSKGDLSIEEYLIDLGNIERRFNSLINIEKVSEIGSDKNILTKGDIVIPKIQPQMGNFFLNLEHKRFLGSTELIEYNIGIQFNPYFFYYLITSKKFLTSLSYLESGKTHRRVNHVDLLRVKIPLLSLETQQKVVAMIVAYENNLAKLKSQICSVLEIINNVFSKTFNFDKSLFNKFGKGMTAGTQLSDEKQLRMFFTPLKDLAKSKIFRFSTRYHNPPTKKLTNILSNLKTIRVKDIVDSYEKGVQPIYSQDGEIPVIKIANLKNEYIDLSETELVNSSYFRDLSQNKKLKINDIILCSTGKISLGKIDIFKYKIDAITTVDNYILRLKKSYSPLFFTYFFRSILGFFQIERDFTGATNQIHLYWEQISNFQIPNLPLTMQLSIVKEIESELKKQDDIKRKITFEREKIDKLIEEAIKQ